ncbi:isoprenylcysteine carboxylmethyltransferase family protein [Tardiphaga sp.]|uniref:methyltransferase family protein n=1 Tax=Tardiphaga sp. TaxID=1926292 RepID=UPI00352B9983
MILYARPNVIPWPPILLATAIGLAFLAGIIKPMEMVTNAYARACGVIIVFGGLAIDGWAIITMHRARTNILPHRAADRLVTNGPFRLSRNPIYFGNAVLCLGLSVATANLWHVFTAAIMVLAVDYLAIRREERHLEALFGNDWLRYRSGTPRWIII